MRFGAGCGAGSALVGTVWNLAMLLSRTQGVPGRRLMGTLYPFAALIEAALEWMAVWALCSPAANDSALMRWRQSAGRVMVTGGFLLLALQLSGLSGQGLRPIGTGVRMALLMASVAAIVTVLLWSRLVGIALQHRSNWLAWRAGTVLLGKGGSGLLLFVCPLLFAVLRDPLPLPDGFTSFRLCVTIFWNAIAALVLAEFVAALVPAAARPTQ